MRRDTDVLYTTIGNRMRQIREEARITQAAIAAEAKLSRQSVANIEQGRQRFMVHTLIDIARALGVAPIALLPSADSPNMASLDLERFALSPTGKRFVLSILQPKDKS